MFWFIYGHYSSLMFGFFRVGKPVNINSLSHHLCLGPVLDCMHRSKRKMVIINKHLLKHLGTFLFLQVCLMLRRQDSYIFKMPIWNLAKNFVVSQQCNWASCKNMSDTVRFRLSQVSGIIIVEARKVGIRWCHII